MIRACILDYGSGNVGSVMNLLSAVAENVAVSNDEKTIRESTHILLPGVGSFGAAMAKIKKNIPLTVLQEEVVERKKPFLGICVGMQVLANKGFEFGEHEGLGWIPGSVEKMEAGTLPVPHIGWNDVRIRRTSPITEHFGGGQDFYFVHSYVFNAAQPAHVLAVTEYGGEFCSIVNRDNIYGVQFHPEKSQKAGKQIIKNFLSLS